MAAKKAKSGKKVLAKAKGPLKTKAKAGKKVVKKATSVLGKLAQVSAQLILDTGLLGQPPKRRAVAKKEEPPQTLILGWLGRAHLLHSLGNGP